jgi:hypothetical protein
VGPYDFAGAALPKANSATSLQSLKMRIGILVRGVELPAFRRCGGVMLNTTLANAVGGPEFFELWPFNQIRPTAATVNSSGPGQRSANAEIVPLCTGACVSDFSAYASGQTDAIIDVLGYFNRPTNYSGTHTTSRMMECIISIRSRRASPDRAWDISTFDAGTCPCSADSG